MRAYSVAAEEALHARNLLKDWLGERFLTTSQWRSMEQETVSDLRRTNIFLRLVLFLFAVIIVVSAAALIVTVLFSGSDRLPGGIALLVFAAACYAGAEFAISEYRLYHHGIEEALAVCSVGFLCVGVTLLADIRIAPLAGGIASLWIWHRFGLAYAFLAAMIFAAWLPGYWTTSHTAQHLIVAAIYAAGLMTVAGLRSRYRFTYLNEEYSIAEALLWLGIYLAINLQLSPVNLFDHRSISVYSTPEFPRAFYWFTWVLTWCVWPAVLWRGLRQKDHFVIAVGGTVAVLTLITNKSYLGWPRHTWDPMLLGALLAGVAVLVHRWLSQGPGGILHGFTARRLSGKDKHWMNAGSFAFGIAAPGSTPMNPQTNSSDVRFGGGESGGGGASSDF